MGDRLPEISGAENQREPDSMLDTTTPSGSSDMLPTSGDATNHDANKVRRNLFATVSDGAFANPAFALTGEVVRTVFLNLILASSASAQALFKTILGSLAAAELLLWSIPTFIIVWAMSGATRKAGVVFFLGWLSRLKVFSFLIGAALVPVASPETVLIVIFSIFLVGQLSEGANVPVWTVYTGSLFPPGMLGRVYGNRSLFGGVLSIVFLFIAYFIMTHPALRVALPFPSNFVIIFAMASLLSLLSQVSLIYTVEADYPKNDVKRAPIHVFIKDWWQYGKSRRDIRIVVFSFVLERLSVFGAMSFITVKLLDICDFTSNPGGVPLVFGWVIPGPGEIGLVVTVAFFVGLAMFGRLTGWVIDHYGFRTWRLINSVVRIISFALILTANSPLIIIIAVILQGWCLGGGWTGFFTISQSLAPLENRMKCQLWLALAVMTASPAGIAAGMIGDRYGLNLNFSIAIGIACVNLVFSAICFPAIRPKRHTTTV
ncbi:MAG: MFS transporter [Planctomycetota bacterium]